MRILALLLLISYSMLFVCSMYGADEIQALNDRGDGHKINIKLPDNGDGTNSYSVSLAGVGVSENTLDVHVKEIHTNMINSTMHFETTTATTFATNVTAQSRSFTVVSAVGFSIGDRIQIEDGIVETNFPSITNIVGNVITINRPFDRSYTTSDGIRKILVNMAVDGSVTPVSFKIEAEASTSPIHITKLLFNMSHITAGDMGTFGNLPPLNKGVLFRAFYKRTNTYKTVAIWKTNADIAIDMASVNFDIRSGGGGTYGTSGMWLLTSAGVVAELDPSEPPDFLEFLIQDDLSSMLSFTCNFQGYSQD